MTTTEAAWRGRRVCDELKAAAAHSGEQGFVMAPAVTRDSLAVERCAEE